MTDLKFDELAGGAWRQSELYSLDLNVASGRFVPGVTAPVALEYPWPPLAPWHHLTTGGRLRGHLDRVSGSIDLEFELIAFSMLGPVEAVGLMTTDGVDVPADCAVNVGAAPKLGEAHPDPRWAATARLAVRVFARDQRLRLEERLWIYAVVAGKRAMMGMLRMGH